MNWLFKIGNSLYTKELNANTLEEVEAYLNLKKSRTGFLNLDNTLININLIEQICEESRFINGSVRFK